MPINQAAKGAMDTNPYQAPGWAAERPPQRATVLLSLLRPARPHVAVSIWFVSMFALHVFWQMFTARFGPVALVARTQGVDYSPLLWLVLAAGIYWRFGFVRRFVLLIGWGLIIFWLFVCIHTVVGPAELTGVSIGPLHSKDPPVWLMCVMFLALPACFLYPMVVLWPAGVRAAFRDRLPPLR